MQKGLALTYFCSLVAVALSSSLQNTCPEVCSCIQDLTNCQAQKLSALPHNIDRNVAILDLSHNDFKKFPDKLNSFTNLTQLNISHNNIFVLKHTALEGLTNLELLDLAYNMFSDWIDIHSQAFSSNKQLKVLNLSHNPLRSVPSHLNPLKIDSLEMLSLVNCSMRHMNENILDRLPNIRELRVSQNPIAFLNTTFASPTLKLLDLSQCEVRQVSAEAFTALTALETLSLADNPDLKSFSCSSVTLARLDLSNCNLEAVPSGALGAVRFANFHGNHFRAIKARSFANLPGLEHLDLSYNALSMVAARAFAPLGVLQGLDMSFNTLRHLDTNLFRPNVALMRLNVSHNYLYELGGFHAAALEVLDLSSNEIRDVGNNSLAGMPHLKELNLSYNRIAALPDGWAAQELARLDVSVNHVRSIGNATFSLMPSLRTLDLSWNGLTGLQPAALSQVTALKVGGNPWRCECAGLRDVYLWLVQMSGSTAGLLCSSPAEADGLSWAAACHVEWRQESPPSHSWWYSMMLMGAVIALLAGAIAMRKIKECRHRWRQETQRAVDQDALRQMRRRQLEMREPILFNAPDPRDLQGPPSYSEAMQMPRSPEPVAAPAPVNEQQGAVRRPLGRDRRKRFRRRAAEASERPLRRGSSPDSDSSDEPPPPRVRPSMESDF